jgi:photosystem II stability/assembly factor-like uncharacterized protein
VVGSYKENGKGGFIARTTNGGQTWDSIVPSKGLKKYQCIGVKATDANHVIINGGVSHYMVTSDGGQTWRRDSLSKAADFNCLQMLDNQTWWCALDYDNIYITEDAGITWMKQGPIPPPGDMWMLGIDYYNRSLCVAVGSSQHNNQGKIIRTTDGGQTWKLVKETSCWLWKVSFIKNR